MTKAMLTEALLYYYYFHLICERFAVFQRLIIVLVTVDEASVELGFLRQGPGQPPWSNTGKSSSWCFRKKVIQFSYARYNSVWTGSISDFCKATLTETE